ETLGKILPGVDRGIRTDEAVLPVGTWTLVVIALQRRAIIFSVVAKDGAAGLQSVCIAYELVPDEVTDFVAEMAEHCAVRLVHIGAHLFARSIVGLSRTNGDQPLVMTGHGRNDGTI